MQDRFKFRVWNGSNMHCNDFVVTATGFVGKITEEFCGQCSFNQDDLTTDKECILMQCTGLKDKNGKLIYEGDVLADAKHKYIVEWSLTEGYFVRKPWLCALFTYRIDMGTTQNLTIIGNIYENPELLEASDDRH